MSIAREAAARRSRLREMLRTKTQAEAAKTQAELLKQLDSSVSLRTLKRDLRVLRGKCEKRGTKVTPPKGAGGVKRLEVGSTMSVKFKQLEQRLDAIENVYSRVIGLLERSLPELYESNRKLKDWLVQTEYGRIADRKELLAVSGEVEHMRDLFAETVAGQYELTKH